MEDFWVCQHCHSLNRGGTGRCYHCREAMGSKPKEAGAIVRNAATAPARPAERSAQSASFGSGPGSFGAPIPQAPPPFVPGIGQRPAEPPEYLSRPVPPTSPANHEFFSIRARDQEAAERRHRTPIGWLEHRMDMWLVTRPVVGNGALGYLTAVLLVLFLLAVAVAVASLMPALRTGILQVSVTAAWDQVSANQNVIKGVAVALVILATLSIVVLSVFLSLMSHNATGLGAEHPSMGPARAFRAWFRLVWVHLLLAIGIVGPAVLILRGYALPGLILAFVTVELAQRRLDDPLGWMTDLGRFVPDLYAKLGTSGSGGSFLGTTWRASFLAANSLALILYLVPIGGIAIATVANLTGHSDAISWPTAGTTPLQLAVLVAAGLCIVTTCAFVALLIPLSIDLVNRQRTRQNLVRAGRSRPWASAAGDWRNQVPRPEPRPEPSRSLPFATSEERNVPAPQTEPARNFLDDTGPARPGFGTDRPLSNGFDRDDQASLYSPSTTSSSEPWEDPSLGPPPD